VCSFLVDSVKVKMSTQEQTKLSPMERFRSHLRRGVVSTAGAPQVSDNAGEHAQVEGSIAPQTLVEPEASAPALKPAPMPGVFTRPIAPSPAQSYSGPAPLQTAEDRLRKRVQATQEQDLAQRHDRKEIASIRALTRLLEAVYKKPGSNAPSEERITALRNLVVHADSVAHAVAAVFGHDNPNPYVMAQSMEAVVGLVGTAWERDDSIDWPEVISEASADPLIVTAAEAISHAVYQPANSKEIIAERVGISLHGSYWSVYMLGEDVDGITPEIASRSARSIADYVHARDRKFSTTDLHVSWMQGAIRRITDLFCAEVRARFTNQSAPTADQITESLRVAQEGFEGVEFHATKLLEVHRGGLSQPTPHNAPSRPAGG